MTTVVHIVEGVVTRAEVPKDWILCSISGEYRPPEEFRNEGQVQQSRTNCTRTYLMSIGEMELLKAQVKRLQPAVAEMTAEVQHEMQEKTAGMSIAEYIAVLQEFAINNPDARIVDLWDDEVCYPSINQVEGYKNLFTC
jgi:predicted phage-related endonuclease